MRDTRKTRFALVAGLCVAALVVVGFAGGPALSEDREAPATLTKATTSEATGAEARIAQPAAEKDPRELRHRATGDAEADGYEWCASRDPANRYLWSHRPS